jgi:hypothetical protein
VGPAVIAYGVAYFAAKTQAEQQQAGAVLRQTLEANPDIGSDVANQIVTLAQTAARQTQFFGSFIQAVASASFAKRIGLNTIEFSALQQVSQLMAPAANPALQHKAKDVALRWVDLMSAHADKSGTTAGNYVLSNIKTPEQAKNAFHMAASALVEAVVSTQYSKEELAGLSASQRQKLHTLVNGQIVAPAAGLPAKLQWPAITAATRNFLNSPLTERRLLLEAKDHVQNTPPSLTEARNLRSMPA